jgi:FMN phosphatase YigB (HAD superfamily)
MKTKTIFCDIDGTLFLHDSDQSSRAKNKPVVLNGVLEKFSEWDKSGHIIILTTGRRESERAFTERQLQESGLIYDKLLMGIGSGQRIVINDLKPYSDMKTAVAINLERNSGLLGIDFEALNENS